MCNRPSNLHDVPHIVDRTGQCQLPTNTADFESLVSDFMYVDKSSLISYLCHRQGVTLFCRPRRFGKSCALDMVRCFFEVPVDGWVDDHTDLFAGLAIEGAESRCTRERGRHPVVSLSLDGCDAASYDETMKSIAQVIAEEYVRHDYLLESKVLRPYLRERFVRLASGKPENDVELELSLTWLSALLMAHHGTKTVILIDEYDTPITGGCLNGYRKEIVAFFQAWLTRALKASKTFYLSMLTGILYMTPESMFSELDNVRVNTMLDEGLGEAFGFTEGEASALAEHVGKAGLASEMRAWYDGYRSGGSDVYNPWSVIGYLEECVAQPYWTNTSTNGIVRQLVRGADEQTSLLLAAVAAGKTVTLPLDMQTVFDDLDKNPAAVWPQLYQAGYLTTDDTGAANMRRRPRRLRLPNLEVAELFRDELIGRAEELSGSRDNLKALHAAVRGTDASALEAALRRITLDSASFHDLADEGHCHMLLLALLYGMDGYRPPTSNREAGDGRADVLLEPEPGRVFELPAIAIEVKRPRDAKGRDLSREALEANAREVALGQATGNAYVHGMRGRGHIYWGVSFAGRRVACACEAHRS